LHAYRSATQLDSKWYKAWHHWALFNYEIVSFNQRGGLVGTPSTRGAGMSAGQQGGSYLVPAVNGFVRSIDLGLSAEKKKSGHVQQDILRLLTLWFKYGNRSDVVAAIEDGFNQLSIDTWLNVIPQIIARINTPDETIRQSVHNLLLRIGQEHPQALVYPLTVASKSPPNARMRAAETIMTQLENADKNGAKQLIQEAKLLSRELIRVAILWHEQWYEALEEASSRYFVHKDTEGMLQVLQPLHLLMARGAETAKEKQFEQQLGRDLEEAHAHCQRWRLRGDEKDLQQAWDLYYGVFRHINKQLPRMGTLELEHVSPALNDARDLSLSMPGHYRRGDAVTSIRKVASHLNVISSKQRPRKCTMEGSDGNTYQYLLKGHEDLRQDERVMQLFGLVNTLLQNDRESSRRDLQIVRYSVIPLEPNSGLIEWVPDCDTMHGLVKEYRETRKILLNIEHRLMLAMTPDYDQLPLIGKVEVFEHALANTTGQDLNKVLWLKSQNSEDWLQATVCPKSAYKARVSKVSI